MEIPSGINSIQQTFIDHLDYSKNYGGDLVVLVQLLSLVWLLVTPVDPMDCSTSGSSVLHGLLGFAQIPVYWVGDGM